jgi:hypothetical protein
MFFHEAITKLIAGASSPEEATVKVFKLFDLYGCDTFSAIDIKIDLDDVSFLEDEKHPEYSLETSEIRRKIQGGRFSEKTRQRHQKTYSLDEDSRNQAICNSRKFFQVIEGAQSP